MKGDTMTTLGVEPPWAALEGQARQVRTPCGDGEMVWRVWGEGGLPLVLLHGGAGSWLHWIHTIPAFAGERRVIVPDLPGFGDSARPPEEAGGPEIAAIVAAGLEAVIGRGTPYDIAGFSFGGVISGLLASRPGAALRSLTLVGSGGLGVVRGLAPLKRVRGTEGAEREAAHRANLLAWMIADPERIDALAVAIQDHNSYAARFDSRRVGVTDLLLPVLAEVPAPVAGIWGARDHAVGGEPARAEAALRAVRPDAPFQIIPDAGHWVAYEAPAALAAALRRAMSPAR